MTKGEVAIAIWTVFAVAACSSVAAPDGGSDVRGDAPICNGAATSDIHDRAIAEQICAMSSPCHVCVQIVDASGNATTWSARNESPECPCGTPMQR